MCTSKILLLILLLITVCFKCTNAFISTLDSNLNDGRTFMGGTLFLILIFTCQTLSIIICGKNRKVLKKKQKQNTETDREIASDPIDQKLFKSVEERKAKRRKERRRKCLAAEAARGGSSSAVKGGVAEANANGSDFDEDEEESPDGVVGPAAAGGGTNAARRKKKINAIRPADEPPFAAKEEDGYIEMTPLNWQKTT